MNFVSFLFSDIALHENKIALEINNREYTYGSIFSDVKLIANYLEPIPLGSRILLYSENSPFFVTSYLAILARGLVAVPIFAQLTPETIEYILLEVNAQAIITSSKLAKKVAHMQNVKIISEDNLSSSDNSAFNYAKVDENDLAVINFTSGSTGKPKGVMISHKNLIHNTDSIISYLSLSSSDIFLQILPFAYCYGASWLHTIFKVKGKLIIFNQFMLIKKMIGVMIEKNVTGIGGVPSHFQILLRKSNFANESFPKLRFLAQAGGKLQTPYIKELIHAFGWEKIYIMYGQTEATARLSYLPPEFLETKLGSIGKGIPGVELRIVDENMRDVNVGEVGELIAKGNNIMLGYWNDPEETSKVLVQGYLKTGDLAKKDEDGFIYIVDRKKTMIKSGGYRVSSKEIEDVISSCSNVVEVAVVGVPDEIKGEVPIAYVVLSDGNLDLVKHTYKEKLPRFKWPEKIIAMDSLPKNESGKVLYNKLKTKENPN